MKKRIILFVILVIILVSLPIVLFQIFEKSEIVKTEIDLPEEQWALHNTGQVIKDEVGVSGIDINVLEAWEITKGSNDVIIGILDSGVDIDCIEIRDNIFLNNKEIANNGLDDDNNGYIDDIHGWNFYNDNNVLFEDYLCDYHGTYISGVISASHEKGNLFGIAPNVKLLPLKFLRNSSGQTKDAINAIEYAYSLGVRIINCSWDTPIFDNELYSTIKKYSDILFICSGGKNGKDLKDYPVYPACYDLPNVICVAAVDNQGNLYRMSGYGDSVDLAAPGVNILSSMADGKYMYSDGTSVATAHVTGIAALVKSYSPELSAEEIANILRKSVTKTARLENKVATNGIIDATMCLKNAK